jgi:hypothetical protein
MFEFVILGTTRLASFLLAKQPPHHSAQQFGPATLPTTDVKTLRSAARAVNFHLDRVPLKN